MSYFMSKAQQNITLWLQGDFPEELKAKIRQLQIENPEELEDAFYTNLAFGTGGLRGIMGVGTNRMNECTIALATQGFANYILQNFKSPKVAIAYDVRHNSEFFARRTAEVFSANNIEVYLFSAPSPTPLLSFSIRELDCSAGVVITASHNPKEYNGYKVYWNDGAQVTFPHDKLIIEEVNKLTINEVKKGNNPKLINYIDDEMDKLYMDMVESQIIPATKTLSHRKQLKIVYSPLHGTGSSLLPNLFTRLGFSEFSIPAAQAVMDGDFPTIISPNPEDSQAMHQAIELAKSKHADVIFATDPDADRIGVGISIGNGEYLLLNGNQTAALLFDYILKMKKEQNLLTSKSYILKTIVTSELLNKIAKYYNVNCYDTLTGFKWMAKVIREKEEFEQYIVGGEESFGILIGDKVRDKDGISAVVLFAEMFARYKSENIQPLVALENIYRQHGFFYEALYSITKTGATGVQQIEALMNKYRDNPPSSILGVEVIEIIDYNKGVRYCIQSKQSLPVSQPKSNVLQFILADQSKISLRPSGTEPKIKFYISIFESDYQQFANYQVARNHAEQKINAYVESLGFLQ